MTIDLDDLNRKLNRETQRLDRRVDELDARVARKDRAQATDSRLLREELEHARSELALGRTSRQQLREQLDAARVQLDKTRAELATADRIRRDLRRRLNNAEADLVVARKQMRVDGELLCYVIAEACPLKLTEAEANELAVRAVTELARIGPGVTVFSGHTDTPWAPHAQPDTPNDAVTTVAYTDGCAPPPNAPPDSTVSDTVSDNLNAERHVRYGVFKGPKPGVTAVCVAETDDLVDARFAAKTHPGSWIGQRVVITHGWTPVD